MPIAGNAAASLWVAKVKAKSVTRHSSRFLWKNQISRFTWTFASAAAETHWRSWNGPSASIECGEIATEFTRRERSFWTPTGAKPLWIVRLVPIDC